MDQQFDLKDYIAKRWLGSYSSVWLVGDESYEYITQIQQAAEWLNEELPRRAGQRGDAERPVKVVCHDKVSGLHAGMPTLKPASPKSQQGPNALRMAMASGNQLEEEYSGEDLPFDPEDNLIFVFKDIEFDIEQNPIVGQLIRNIIAANMHNDDYAQRLGRGARGQRMLVFLTTKTDLKHKPPELKPTIVPLPGPTMLKRAMHLVLAPAIEAGVVELSDDVEHRIVTALRGFTYQKAEDVMSLALSNLRGIEPLEDFIDLVEQEKASYMSEVAGLTYVAKKSLPAGYLPGYEAVLELVDQAMATSPEKAEYHRLGNRVKGMSFGGAPGTGKTEMGKLVAKRLDRVLLLLNLGEVQQGIVGESEKMMRRAMQIAESQAACLLLDDVDKAGLSGASRGTTGDSGVYGRIVNMMLTQMSEHDSQATYIFTFNRAQGVPPELMRPGRIDARYFVERPDGSTRQSIFRIHADRHRVTLPESEQAALESLAHDLTEDWTGAEIADLVRRATRRAVAADTDELDVRWMCEEAKLTTPMARMKLYQEDIKAMEEQCSQFTRIGRTAGQAEDMRAKPARTRRAKI